MSEDFCRVTLNGRLGSDPQKISNGKAAKFSVAENRSEPDGHGGYKDVVQWHSVVVWRPDTAEYCIAHLRKGDRVTVDGLLRTETFEKDDGSKSLSVDIVVNQVVGSVEKRVSAKRKGKPATTEELADA